MSDNAYLLLVGLLGSLAIGFVSGFGLGHDFGQSSGIRDFKQQAFDRGYMVQCIGKEGYYWECEE